MSHFINITSSTPRHHYTSHQGGQKLASYIPCCVEVEVSVVASLKEGEGRSKEGTDMVLRWNTNFNSDDGRFITDDGLVMKSRSRGDTPNTWVSSGFFPAVSASGLRGSDDSAVVFLTRQSMGVSGGAMDNSNSNNKKGFLEMVLHRNHKRDDGRGLATGLNDDSRVTIDFQIMGHATIAKVGSNPEWFRQMSAAFDNPLVTLMHTQVAAATPATWKAAGLAGIVDPLGTAGIPHPGLHLASLMARDAVSDDVVIRLQNFGTSPESIQLTIGQMEDEGGDEGEMSFLFPPDGPVSALNFHERTITLSATRSSRLSSFLPSFLLSSLPSPSFLPSFTFLPSCSFTFPPSFLHLPSPVFLFPFLPSHHHPLRHQSRSRARPSLLPNEAF
jgi:hypothetical protein